MQPMMQCSAAMMMWLVLLVSSPVLMLALPLMNPPELRSKDGLLDVYLVAEQTQVMFNDNNMISLMTWNGSYVPPTLRLLPGDGFRLTIENRLSETTNVHFHGLAVSPNLPADDSLYQLPPAAMSGSTTSGSSLFTYTFRIPTDHSAGLYFYHSHSSNSEMQVFQGLSGLIVIEGVLNPFSVELQMIKEQFFALKDLQIQNGSVPSVIDLTASTIRTINGIVNPTITIRPNEVQFWRIANVGADLLYKLTFSNITVFEIARDGRLLNQPVVDNNGYFLGPGNRAEFLVIGPPSVGMYMLRSLAILNGEHGPSYPGVDLATIVSEGSMVMSPPNIPSASEFPSIIDLRTSKLSTKRVIEYTMMNSSSSGAMMMTMSSSSSSSSGSGTGMQSTTTTTTVTSSRTTTATTTTTTTSMNGMMTMGFMKKRQMMMTTSGGDTWMINNRMYDSNRIDVSVSLGSTELWIIRNCDLEYHNFHIHQVGFQVISINNVTVEPFVGYQDTITVPPADSMAGCSEVQVIIAFTNPIIVGKFLFHCHIMKHEDRGMMAIIQVTDNRNNNNNSPPYSLSPVLLAVLLVVVLVLAIVLVVLAIYLYKSLQKKKANSSAESDYHLTI